MKLLEELVSQSNIIQAQEDITEQRRLQAESGRDYVYFWDGFSFISQDPSIRLGQRLVPHKILSLCTRGMQQGHREIHEREFHVARGRACIISDGFHDFGDI